jgi:hypothetical protein
MMRAAKRVGVVLCYNQEELVVDAIASLLNQSVTLDLIIVSDDASSDRTVVNIQTKFGRELESCRVLLNTNDQNLGFIAHLNKVIGTYIGRDDLVFYNAGDDTSEPNRVGEFICAYERLGAPEFFLGHSLVAADRGNGTEILVPPIVSIGNSRDLQLIASAYHIGASQVFTGNLFLDYGGILFNDCYEDLVLGYRALLKNAYFFVPLPLVNYKLGGISGWRNNTLEKKRARFKSTLLQRSVDSIISGNDLNLQIITDCYRQYGFDGLTYPDRVQVYKPVKNSEGGYVYSVSDTFCRLANVIDTVDVTVHNIRSCMSAGAVESCVWWLPLGQLSPEFIAALTSNIEGIKNKVTVVDVGVLQGGPGAGDVNIDFDLLDTLMGNLERGVIHCSCPNVGARLIARYGSGRVTYLHPLHDVDGADPSCPHSLAISTKGLIVTTCHGHRGVAEVVNALESMSTSGELMEPIKLELFNPGNVDIKNTDRMPTLTYVDKLTPGDIDRYGFIIILNNCDVVCTGFLNLWWSLAAKYAVPAFISGPGSREGLFQHGNTGLVVDDHEQHWIVVFRLLQSNVSAINEVSIRAREFVYFEASIQKKMRSIVDYFGGLLGKSNFFDKFLPL